MHFPIFLAGFFAKSQIMFFLPSPFRFLPPLKNDGRGDTFFNGSTFLPVILERSEESRQRWVLFFNGIKKMPVILERSEESGQRIQALNTFSDIPCRILR